jgi:hypothetical protein
VWVSEAATNGCPLWRSWSLGSRGSALSPVTRSPCPIQPPCQQGTWSRRRSCGPGAGIELRDVRHCRGHGLRRTVTQEVITVTNDRLLAEAVRALVSEELPGDRAAADRAAFRALEAYRGGATVAEACHDAWTFVGSWVRHPAHGAEGRDGLVALAS